MIKQLRKLQESPWVFVAWVFLAWKVWMMAFLYLGLIALPQQKDFLGGGAKYLAEPYLWAWANFDGEHYLSIAQRGYGELEQAFFPVYPYLVRWFAGVYWTDLKVLLLVGLVLLNGCFYLGLVWFYKLVRLDFKKEVAEWSVLALAVAPTSFFFGSVYTESLFLLLSVGAFWAARKRKWWLAGLLAGIASATMVIGVVLFFALLAEWWWQRKKENKGRWWELAASAISLSGLVFYMRFLAGRWGDALYFLHAQPYFGAGRSIDKLVLLYQVFWRYAKMISTVDFGSVAYFTVRLELGAALLFLLLGLVSLLRQRWSYSIFVVLAYLMPTLTGTFLSLPRFVLALFPAFILLGEGMVKIKWLKWGYLVVSCILAGATTALFVKGFWVG